MKTRLILGISRRLALGLGPLFWVVLCCAPAAALPLFQVVGRVLVMSNANVRLEYHLDAGTTDFYWKDSQKISGFYSGVDTGFYFTGRSYPNHTFTLVSSNQAIVTSTGGALPIMRQYFVLDRDDSFLTRVEVSGTALKSRWMGPVVVDPSSGWVDLGITNDNRALIVPFDNDHFVRYQSQPINTTGTSYEVGAFYDNTSRMGLVVGSVTHDTWKSGIYFQGGTDKLVRMNAFGGAASPTMTWDVMPHGQVTGDTITSPTFFVGFSSDWRSGLEAYADANARVASKLSWTNAVLFGWNSWYAFGSSLSYTQAIAISDSLHDSGFNNGGMVYVNLDSYWDNFSSAQLQAFVVHCHKNGQKAGIYWAPFAWWGAAADATNTTVEGSSFRYSQALLRTSDTTFQSNDGALAMDPTHPATKLRINYYLQNFLNLGFDFVKLDFLSHGALEGVHYDTNITTGIQAYNQGMQQIVTKLAGRMFISASIAPLFPYQYAHARRIACDTSRTISDTEYEMESVTYGWWLNRRLYAFNDPDAMQFAGVTPEENQSRLISGAISGTVFLSGDDLTSPTTRALALGCLTNSAIAKVARAGLTFRPVEGNTGTQAADVFVSQDGATYYIALFNYGNSVVVKNVDFVRSGISGTFSPLDLWTGQRLLLANSSLAVVLKPKQARLLRLRSQPTLSISRSDQAFSSFLISAEPSEVYAIERSTNLTSWAQVGTISNALGPTPISDTNSSASESIFYRARLAP